MKKILKSIDKPLLIISIILFAFGLLMIYSSSNVTAYMKHHVNPYYYFIRQLIFVLGSFIISMFLLKLVPTKAYGGIAKLLMIPVVVSLVYLLVYGTVKNQASSWIDLGFFSIQPSEFAKIIVIIYLASYYNKHKDNLDNILVALSPLVIPASIAVLIFLQPDLGTTIIFTAIVCFIFFSSPIASEIKRKILTIGVCFILVIVLVILTSGKDILKARQLQRFDFSNPCSSEKFYSTGNQVCNGYIAINNGGLFGTGLGNSTQKYLYLPEAYTDFIFPIIVEELGLAGSCILFVLYFLLIGRIIKIGRESINNRGAIICYGVAFYILLHILINLGGVLGLLPMTGVPLPFISYGGSYAMCLIFALMFVNRVNYENKYESKE